MSKSLQTVVEQEVLRWASSFDELCQSYRDFLGNEGSYLCHPDMPTVTGSAAALELIDGFHTNFGVETIEVEWLEIVQVGQTVWNERLDYMVNAGGERFLTIPIAGRFSFDDHGKLVSWRDYWDMRPLLALASPAAA